VVRQYLHHRDAGWLYQLNLAQRCASEISPVIQRPRRDRIALPSKFRFNLFTPKPAT
jgi:hypothetical protein